MNGYCTYTSEPHWNKLNMLGILFAMFLSDALFNIWPIEHFSIHLKSVIFEQWSANNAQRTKAEKTKSNELKSISHTRLNISVNAIIQWMSIVNGALVRYDLMFVVVFDAINVQIKWIDNATQINPRFVSFHFVFRWIILTLARSEDFHFYWRDLKRRQKKRKRGVMANTECC